MNAPPRAPSRALPVAGIAAILATVFAMALTDAIVKLASDAMTLWQIYALRSALVIPVLLAMARRTARAAATRWVAARSLCLTLMYVAIYAAIPVLDLAVIAAALYAAPIFIVVLAALFLRERITGFHWAGMGLGFAGVLLIVRPATGGLSALVLIPLSAALLYAAAATITRARCTRTDPVAMALWLNVALLLLGVGANVALRVVDPAVGAAYPFVFGVWTSLVPERWWIVAVLAALMLLVSIGLAKAYQSPRPDVVAAFDYAYLVFAAGFGFLFFGEVPTSRSALGLVLVVASGLVVSWAAVVASRSGSVPASVSGRPRQGRE